MQKEYLYPSCDVDIYSDRHTLNDIGTKTLDQLNDEIALSLSSNPIQSINALGEVSFKESANSDDKELIEDISKHLMLINESRIQISKVIDRDMHSDNAKIRLADIKYTLVVIGIMLGGIASSGIMGNLYNGLVGTVVDGAAGATFVGLSIKQLQGLRLGTKEQLSREKVKTVDVLTVNDVTVLKANKKTYDMYTNDLRCFMLLALSCNYTTNDYKELLTQLKARANKFKNTDVEYMKYIDTTVIEAKDIKREDFSLFRFYEEYLEFKTARTRLEVSSIVNQFYYTQAGIDTLKCFMDKFINAYFATKAYIAPMLEKVHKSWNENLRLIDIEYIQLFAKLLKLCLLLQSVSIDTANKLVKNYMQVNNIKYTDGSFEYDYSGEK